MANLLLACRSGGPARLSALCIALLAVSVALVPSGWATVTVNPWADPNTELFDPEHPPADLPPGEDADATPRVSVTGGGCTTTQWDPKTSSYGIASLGDIEVSGHTDIRLPNNADATLREHENGHNRLSKDEYDRNVRRKVEEAFRGFTEMTFTGEGTTDDQKQASAKAKISAERDKRLNRAARAISQQMFTLNDKYDLLTKHGKSDTVNTAQGEQKAKAERDRAPAAGAAPLKPDESKRSGSVGDPPRVFFDDNSQELHFGGDRLMDHATNPFDAILGRGEVWLEPMVLIGVQDNGTVHLSDTRLQIIDSFTGDVLLDGFVFEAAYMPSTLPGYSGMIQAYLDIPPDWAGGINNTIGSDFLAEMQAASEAGDLTMLWFYADAPLFDENGQDLIGYYGVTGAFKLGVPVPEPIGVGGAFLLLGVLAASRRRSTRVGPHSR